ncbi:MAG: serine/threonine-protein kinase [Nostocaceae cyanobacterium]|nr:serine/threonine-protein kinase [Nostocaceae cyanobacterium]
MVWTTGQRLQGSKYTIQKKLGSGGFGITYLVTDSKGNQFVIKTLKQTDDIDSDEFDKYQQDFVNEALKLAKCSHPHIVQVYECIKEGDLWGIVMEYVEGEDLICLSLPLPESEALLYIQQIGQALTVVHKKGLLHRDVKPQNIMLRAGKSEAVLIDFGIAREFSPDATLTHTAFLTPFYAPPEQYNPRAKRGAYMDVYSLAATLYKLLTGQEPEASVSRVMGCPLKPPQDINKNISDRVNQAILKGLELNPENRPQSMQEWLNLLLPQTAPETTPDNDDLSSSKGLDYTNLRDLLKAGKWREADRETIDVMLKVAGREEQRWLDVESIENFPCTDLRTIDKLWVKYSNGRFGFSVQKRIWESVGGKPNADYETWCKFGDRVGWRVNQQWLDYENLTFNTKAQEGQLGQLPLVGDVRRRPAYVGGVPGWRLGGGWGFWGGVLSSLLSRPDL